MRIQQVRFKNLNSLAGEWTIDLTQPDYVADGIFAITGPTGAGKSTILDAICLALYGGTPRLGKVTLSGNEIMSRQTGECFAEVTFETQSGRYRCHWSQHRARKKHDGGLQSPKHEIADANSGEVLESKIRGVAAEIESATGMDFDRFTRSMLLAQGSFDRFLKAEADQRAPILEQITGTEIYSRISVRVHERRREEHEKLERLTAEVSGIQILDAEQEKEIGQELEDKQKEEGNLANKAKRTQKGIDWLKFIEDLNKEIAGLDENAKTLEKEFGTFKPDREILERALKAATLDGVYATLKAYRKAQADDQTALKEEQEALPELESSSKELGKTLKSAEEETRRAKKERDEAAPVLQKVRSLDQSIAGQKKAVSEVETECKDDAAKIKSDEKARSKTQEKHSEAEAKIGVVADYLKEHALDEWLVSGLAGVEEQLDGLQSVQGQVTQKETGRGEAAKALAQATKAFEDCQKQSGKKKQALEDATQQLQKGKDALTELLDGRDLRAYRNEKDGLLREAALLAKIAALEDHRANLEDGEPCPLCGAIEHPYAEGNVPAKDETEKKIDALNKVIETAEEQEAAITKLEEAKDAAREDLTEVERLELAAASDKKAAEKTLKDAKTGLEELLADLDKRRLAVLEKLQPLGITEMPADEVASIGENLKARLDAWQAKVKDKATVEKEIADIVSELKRLGAVIESNTQVLDRKQERLETLKKELASVAADRKALYEDKDPDEEERRLKQAVASAEEAEKQARERLNKLQEKLTAAKTQVHSLKKGIETREPELAKRETEFSGALAPAGFSDEEQFTAAILSAERRAELDTKAKELDNRQTELKARRKDRNDALAKKQAEKVTDKGLDELEPELQGYEESLKSLRDDIAELKQRLKQNAEAKDRIKEKQAAIEAQTKECRRWGNLHGLIGSADGKRYRNFAQGLTFEMMIGHANRQLQKMTDRYLLARDEAQPLELNVIDNYQAGETRSTKNLSGGESFIVSLALALGLSHMASRKVRVDSLFLDEGFGTLDEEALGTALETLAGLQQDGKLIGVISHVSALKERIRTQIQVTPRTGGRSNISGPGCGRAVPA